jgi:hypothetical protein
MTGVSAFQEALSIFIPSTTEFQFPCQLASCFMTHLGSSSVTDTSFRDNAPDLPTDWEAVGCVSESMAE